MDSYSETEIVIDPLDIVINTIKGLQELRTKYPPMIPNQLHAEVLDVALFQLIDNLRLFVTQFRRGNTMPRRIVLPR